MKIDRQLLLNAIKSIKHIARRDVMQGANMVYISSKPVTTKMNYSKLSLSCMGEFKISTSLFADGIMDFDIVVDVKKLHDLLSKLENGEITLDIKEQVLILKQGKGSYKIAIVTKVLPNDFLDLIGDAQELIIGANILKSMINRVIGSVDAIRYNMINFSHDGKQLVLAGTNALILSVAKTAISSEPFNFNITPSVALEMTKILDTGNVKIKFKADRLLIEYQSFIINDSLHTTNFPNLGGIIDINYEHSFKVNTNILLNKLSQMLTVSDTNNVCKLTADKSILNLSSRNYEDGTDGETQIQISAHDHEETFLLNIKNLQILLKTIHTEDTVVSYIDNKRQMLIEPTEGSYFHVVMPLK